MYRFLLCLLLIATTTVSAKRTCPDCHDGASFGIGRICSVGQACGAACISNEKHCRENGGWNTNTHQGSAFDRWDLPCKCPSSSARGGPACKKGKPCGNACIACDKQCHKTPAETSAHWTPEAIMHCYGVSGRSNFAELIDFLTTIFRGEL